MSYGYNEDSPMLKIDTEHNRHEDRFTISMTMKSLHDQTAKQADRYLKELIAQGLKTAVMQHYPQIQVIVDELIHSHEMRLEFERIIKEEFAKKVKQSIEDMFG